MLGLKSLVALSHYKRKKELLMSSEIFFPSNVKTPCTIKFLMYILQLRYNAFEKYVDLISNFSSKFYSPQLKRS